jgi:hypothetical protein
MTSVSILGSLIAKNFKYLSGKKVLYALVDNDDIKRKNFNLYTRMHNMTSSFTHRLCASTLLGTIKTYDNIDLAMLDSDEYDIVIIQHVGNFIRINKMYQYIDEYCFNNPNYFIIAFTLDWQSEKNADWLEIHNQMIIVNPAVWKQLGSPKFGRWVTVTEELPNYTRSVENFHDNYTPYWIQGQPGTTVHTRTRPGWGWLKAALSNNIRIDNFTLDMRNSRLYVYPGSEPDKFYKALTDLNEVDLKNPNQRKLIKQWMKTKPQIWIFNSEAYSFNYNNSNLDTYIGPAAGFKFLDMLIQNPNIKFIFYDYNPLSIQWLQHLKNNWDGNNFEEFLDKQTIFKPFYKFIDYSIKNNVVRLFREFGGEDNFKTLWLKFKNAEAEFVVCDLFKNNEIPKIINGAGQYPFINFSNIFSTDYVSMFYSIEEVEEIIDNFIKLVREERPFAVFNGNDHVGIQRITESSL